MSDFEQVLRKSSLGEANDWSDDLTAETVQEARNLVRRAAAQGAERYSIGIEVLPEEIFGVVTDGSGESRAEGWARLTGTAPADVVGAAAALARQLASKVNRELPDDRVVLGIQLGGPVDPETGRVISYRKVMPAGAIHWDEEDLAGPLELALGVPILVLNDAEALAFRELWVGIGDRSSRFVVLLIRQGVGGSLVLDANVADVPFEIGNLSIYSDGGGPTCDCGQKGCLELTAGTLGIVERVQGLLGSEVDGLVAAAELANDTDHESSIKALEAFAAAGNAMARGIGASITMLRPKQVVIYAPQIMIDTGTRVGAVFTHELECFDRYVSHRRFHDCEVVYRPLRPYSGAHGAAVAALTKLLEFRPASNVVRGAQ